MKTLRFPTAQRIAPDTAVEPLTLVFEGEVETGDLSVRHAGILYDEQARQIEHALVTTLAGGLYDKLLAAMLDRRASHFRVAFGCSTEEA